ncbi:hypothetical protein EVAR_57017_1 [Eumeta japonica]|uniref:Uncharacterized protein n=1 Tax=Eumeta variegata TaxID=151549 RepID=A0A4C2A733_EUMVA|nr:hypothetical protein EVAR_57017_1 [Eumeta japonica]
MRDYCTCRIFQKGISSRISHNLLGLISEEQYRNWDLDQVEIKDKDREKDNTIVSTDDVSSVDTKDVGIHLVHTSEIMEENCPQKYKRFDSFLEFREKSADHRKKRAHREERQSGVRAYAAIAEIAVTAGPSFAGLS